LAALERAETELNEAGILTYKVTDAGRTVFPEPTVTVLSCGPAYYEDLPKYVQRFNLLTD
jgi:peptidyl-tRNA hydrolase